MNYQKYDSDQKKQVVINYQYDPKIIDIIDLIKPMANIKFLIDNQNKTKTYTLIFLLTLFLLKEENNGSYISKNKTLTTELFNDLESTLNYSYRNNLKWNTFRFKANSIHYPRQEKTRNVSYLSTFEERTPCDGFVVIDSTNGIINTNDYFINSIMNDPLYHEGIQIEIENYKFSKIAIDDSTNDISINKIGEEDSIIYLNHNINLEITPEDY